MLLSQMSFSAGDSRIGFRVKEPARGFELLRDGNRLSEH